MTEAFIVRSISIFRQIAVGRSALVNTRVGGRVGVYLSYVT